MAFVVAVLPTCATAADWTLTKVDVPGDRAGRRGHHQYEQRRRGKSADQPRPIEPTPSEIAGDRAGDEVVRELPHALRRIERACKRRRPETGHHRPHLARPQAGLIDQFLLGTRPFGALLGHQLFQHARREVANCGLFDRLFDVMAHEAAGVERRRSRAALREHVADDVQGDRPNHARAVVQLGRADRHAVEPIRLQREAGSRHEPCCRRNRKAPDLIPVFPLTEKR
jgi:hypothetical protein